jgi:hypothetical protein
MRKYEHFLPDSVVYLSLGFGVEISFCAKRVLSHEFQFLLCERDINSREVFRLCDHVPKNRFGKVIAAYIEAANDAFPGASELFLGQEEPLPCCFVSILSVSTVSW